MAKIKIKPKKPKAGKAARIKAILTAVDPAAGTLDGKVVIKDGKKKLGKFKLKKGKAKVRLRNLTAGRHKIKVKYKGGENWKPSKGTKKFRVRG